MNDRKTKVFSSRKCVNVVNFGLFAIKNKNQFIYLYSVITTYIHFYFIGKNFNKFVDNNNCTAYFKIKLHFFFSSLKTC